MEKQLESYVAIVTGSTKGIGKAIAKDFAMKGADVIVIGTNKERAEKVVQELEQLGSKSFYKILDVSDFDAVHQAMDEVLQKTGKIDILVNNAGITKDNLLMKMSEEDWDRVIDVNLKSAYNFCHALIRPMMKARFGKIINITSVVGLTGNMGQVNYSSSKAGLIGLTKSVAKEVATRGICVNAIAPGFIETEMTGQLKEEVKQVILNQIPMKRIGNVEDIAKCASFLASKDSDYITGQVFTVDGGMTT